VVDGLCCIVVPVRLQAAKSRLSLTPAPLRAALMAAMAQDVIETASACPAVGKVIVVGDELAREALVPRLGPTIHFVNDPGDGLNVAITTAASGTRGFVAALLADLPCVTPEVLERALSAAGAHRAIMSDAEGIGTTLLMAPDSESLSPQFGPRSRAAHVGSGAVDLRDTSPGEFARLRRDVDSEVDVWDARRIGVGPATHAVLAQHVT
jgi:2-phospho-L-lactate/phosphoenolpyruvate guanylyltransferase